MQKYKNKEYLYEEWIVKKRSQSQIALDNKITTRTIEYWIKKHNLSFKRHRSNQNIESDKFNLNDLVYCYMLGFIASDGCLIKNTHSVYIVIKSKDSYILKYFVNYFELPVTVKHIKKDCCSLRFNSSTLYRHCLDLGMMPSVKTYQIKFPKSIDINIKDKDTFYKFYLRGVFDGDANIRSNSKFRILSASSCYLYEMANFLNNKFKFEIPLTIRKQKKNIKGENPIYYPLLEVGSIRGKVILNWIYSGNYEIGLKRKIDIAITSK